MLGPVLFTCLTHFIRTITVRGWCDCSPHFTDGKLKHGEVKSLFEVPTANTWQTWVLNPGSLAPESGFLGTHCSSLRKTSDLFGGAWPWALATGGAGSTRGDSGAMVWGVPFPPGQPSCPRLQRNGQWGGGIKAISPYGVWPLV